METIHRPIHDMEDVVRLVHSDIEAIYRCLGQGKFCHQAKEQLNLLGEKYDYPEEVNGLFARLAGKLDGAMMIAPETVPGLYTATNRYGFEWFVYLYHDDPELALQYYDALVDHELFRIDAFARTGLSRGRAGSPRPPRPTPGCSGRPNSSARSSCRASKSAWIAGKSMATM